MTKTEWIERHRHAIMGHICEGVYAGRRDELLAKWMRATMSEIDGKLGEMFEELRVAFTPPKPAEPAPLNGKAANPTR